MLVDARRMAWSSQTFLISHDGRPFRFVESVSGIGNRIGDTGYTFVSNGFSRAPEFSKLYNRDHIHKDNEPNPSAPPVPHHTVGAPFLLRSWPLFFSFAARVGFDDALNPPFASAVRFVRQTKVRDAKMGHWRQILLLN